MMSSLLGWSKYIILRVIMGMCCVYTQVTYGEYCPPINNNVHIIGIASHAKTGEFLYCEYHTAEGPISHVIYTNAKQETIASKIVDSSMSLLAPNFHQNDRRHNEVVSVTRQQSLGHPFEITFLLQYQAANKTKRVEKVVAGRPDVVVDAGFDHAIRHYWDDLAATGEAGFTFVVPAKMRTIQLAVKVGKLSQCLLPQTSTNSYDGSRHVCYVVKPKSVLLSWFVKPIKLLYESTSQRLIWFSGSGNVSTNSGNGQRVNISYDYVDGK